MQYASIDRVYKNVQTLYNKDQQGNIKPVEYNRLADLKQKEVFEEVMEEYINSMRGRRLRNEIKDGTHGSFQSIKENVRTLHRYLTPLTNISNNSFSYPSDYYHYTDVLVGGKKAGIHDSSSEDLTYQMGSIYTAANSAFPKAVLTYLNVTVFPDNITDGVSLSYYKIPQGSDSDGNPSSQPPTWAYDTVGGNTLYNATASINFELPVSMEVKLTRAILLGFGVNMREEQIIQYVSASKQIEDRKELI